MPPANNGAIKASNSHGFRQSSTADEVTPLLASTNAFAGAGTQEEPSLLNGDALDGTSKPASAGEEDHHDEVEDVPLPKTQIALLCLTRLVEPIAFFSIFPFINKMIRETGNLKEADVGFYSGLIESLFSFTQMLLMIPWGWAADRVGRKPVLVFSLAGVSIAAAMFGFSKHIWQMILFRCTAGLFAGTVVTIRALITENTTRKTEARAFSFFAFAGNLGIFIGPLLGGALAAPAEQYPRAFGHIKFFRDFPYALPTLITGTIGASATIFAALFIKETLKRKATNGAPAPPPMSTGELLKSPSVTVVLVIYNYAMLLGYAFTAVSPVFWWTSPALGGLGFSPLQISLWLGYCGVCQAIWLLLIFPPLQRRIGTGGVLRLCALAMPILYTLAPIQVELLRHNHTTAFWVLFPIANLVSAGTSMIFTAVQLALNAITPNPGVLGTLNGIALAISAGVRAVAPALFTSIFAVGVGNKILGGHLIWLVLALVAAGNTFIVFVFSPEKINEKPGDVKKGPAAKGINGQNGEAHEAIDEE